MNQMPMPVTTQAMMMAPAEASAAMFWGGCRCPPPIMAR